MDKEYYVLYAVELLFYKAVFFFASSKSTSIYWLTELVDSILNDTYRSPPCHRY